MLEGRRRLGGSRRRRPKRRRWWWLGGPMRAKALRMTVLGGSSPPRMIQGLSFLLLAIMYLLFNNFM
jgi:hypothetical protein